MNDKEPLFEKVKRHPMSLGDEDNKHSSDNIMIESDKRKGGNKNQPKVKNEMVLEENRPSLFVLIVFSVIAAIMIRIYTEVLVSVSTAAEKQERIPSDFNLINLSLDSMLLSTVISSPEKGLAFRSEALPAFIFHDTSLMIYAAIAWNMSDRLEIGELDVASVESDFISISGSKISFRRGSENKMQMGHPLETENELSANSAIIGGKLICSTDQTYNPQDPTTGKCSQALVLEAFEDPLEGFGHVESFDVSGRFVAVADTDEMRIYAVGQDEERLVFRAAGTGSVVALPSIDVAFAYNGKVFRYSLSTDSFTESQSMETPQKRAVFNALGFKLYIDGASLVECLDSECVSKKRIRLPEYTGSADLGLHQHSLPLVIFKDSRTAAVFDSSLNFTIIPLDIPDNCDDVRALPHQSQLLVRRQNTLTYAML